MQQQAQDVLHNIFIYFSFTKITQYILPLVTKLLIVLAIFIVTRMTIKFANKSLTTVCKKQQIDKHTCHVLKTINYYTIAGLGLIIALQNIGIEVSPLVTALGVSGVAISFGMKDIISNIIAGILIMIYKQFEIGDHIKIKDWQGKVIDINIRYTTLQTEDMTVFIPNSILYTTTVAIINQEKN